METPKRGKRSTLRKSTRNEIKKVAQASNPKEVFHLLIGGKGGVEKLTSPGEHPRNYQQVADYRRSGVLQPVVVRHLVV